MKTTDFRNLVPFIRKYKVTLFILFILLAFNTAIEVSLPIILGKTVDSLSGGKQFYSEFKLYCLLFFILILLKSVFETVQGYRIQKTGQGISHDLRLDLFKRILKLKVPYFYKNSTGKILTRVINDIKSVSEIFSAAIFVVVLDVCIIVATIVAMLFLNWKLALLVLVPFPFVIYTIFYFGKRMDAWYLLVRNRLSEINSFLGENIAGVATVQRFSAEEEKLDRFSLRVNSHYDAQMGLIKDYGKIQPITNILNGLSISLLIAAGGYAVINENLSIGVYVAFLSYLKNVFQPVRDLVEKYNTFLSASISARRINQIFDEEIESDKFLQSNKSAVVNSHSLLSFQNVTFSYEGKVENALSNVTFNINKNERVALIGRTGSGKSTIARLLVRFYEKSEGEIIFNGYPIEHHSLQILRKQIAYIQQEIYLFHGTIRENLNVGNLFTDDLLIQSSQKAQLWDYIKNKGGLDLPVWEGGGNLSQGERQLLSFTRVLLQNPELIILDEATSSLDPYTEGKLLKATEEVFKGKTCLIIAHRPSTIETCDRVLELEEGELKA